jgi:HEAT repeat protein
MALGTIRHAPSEALLRQRLGDPDPSVRVAAMFALRRLGDPRFIEGWGQIVRAHPDPAVRRNAVLALGRLEEPGAIALLRRASEDDDLGVQLQAIEGMALLGDTRAVRKLIFYASGGFGDRQAFALTALGETGNPVCLETLRYCLKKAPHLETRLAAARALGMMGKPEGYHLALKSLTWDKPKSNLPDDPPANQIMRVRTLAAFALGAIGRRDALPALQEELETAEDERVQLAMARAILEILGEPDVVPAAGPGAPASPHAP